MDDALRIERVLHDFAPPWLEPLFVTSTAGSVALYINSNEQTDTQDTRSWMYFNTEVGKLRPTLASQRMPYNACLTVLEI